MINLDELHDMIVKSDYYSHELSVVLNGLMERGFIIFNPAKRKPSEYFIITSSKIAKEKANYTCELCGCNDKKKIIAHHKFPLGNISRELNLFNHPSNLQVLCRSCHTKLHKILKTNIDK